MVSGVLASGRDAFGRPIPTAAGSGLPLEYRNVSGTRFAFAEMAALRTRAKGGLMPHARHGGSGNDSVAMVGSKFEGTGLEKEHMGHTQLPTTRGGGAGETAAG